MLNHYAVHQKLTLQVKFLKKDWNVKTRFGENPLTRKKSLKAPVLLHGHLHNHRAHSGLYPDDPHPAPLPGL